MIDRHRPPTGQKVQAFAVYFALVSFAVLCYVAAGIHEWWLHQPGNRLANQRQFLGNTYVLLAVLLAPAWLIGGATGAVTTEFARRLWPLKPWLAGGVAFGVAAAVTLAIAAFELAFLF